MPKPIVEVLGAYKVEMTPGLFANAMELKFGGLPLSDAQREAAEEHVRSELSSIVLLEVLIRHADERYDAGDLAQPGSDQAAYEEAYLTLDGTAIVSMYDRPAGDSLRVAFFLHFFDPRQPLSTSYGPVPVPPLQKMPQRLAELMPYEPVD